ncbi:MAG TPA: radical SAM protein, partial [Minicystis sp.]|nr:radical SAM protein [Minicystis sp.]
VKYALRTADDHVVETVRIPLERAGRFTACVSSQVGCALACAFCATGRLGLARNLEAWEIVEQVRRVRADLPRGGRVHGVVFQGMGEPLANVDRVIQAIRVLGEPSAQAIDLRNVTVCTAGIPSGILRLAREVPAVRLGVSLGAVRGDKRRALMPIDAAHPLEEVLAAAGAHARATRMAPMFAYTLLRGENDGDDDAAALAELARAFATEHGVAPRLSLIPYNDIGAPAGAERALRFARSERLEAFRAVLRARGVGTIVRYSGGGDVGAACGQLAGRVLAGPAPGG